MSRLAAIAKMAMAYSIEHEDEPPRCFADLLPYLPKTYTDHSYVFVCPATGHLPGCLTNVDAWTDYALCVPTHDQRTADEVLAFCRPENHGGGRALILFADGHVQQYGDLLQYSNIVLRTTLTTNHETRAAH